MDINLTHVRGPADVPELAEEDGAAGAHGVDDGPPRPDLLRGPDSRGVRDRRHPLRPLRVVRGGVRAREVAGRPRPRHRRQHHPAASAEEGGGAWRDRCFIFLPAVLGVPVITAM